MNKNEKEYYVYKFVYNNEIIYIGKVNSDLKNRIFTHFNSGKFDDYKGVEIYCAKLENELNTKYMELLLINKYKPILNKVDKSKQNLFIDFIEPNWEKYEYYIEERANNKSIKNNWEFELDGSTYDSLATLGVNIKNARLRRDLSSTLLSERIGISRATLWKIESGNPNVAIGHYLAVLSALDAGNEMSNICEDKEMILKLDSEMLYRKRASRRYN